MMKFDGKEYPVSILSRLYLPDTAFDQLEFIKKYLKCKTNTQTLINIIAGMYGILKAQSDYIEKGELPESKMETKNV